MTQARQSGGWPPAVARLLRSGRALGPRLGKTARTHPVWFAALAALGVCGIVWVAVKVMFAAGAGTILALLRDSAKQAGGGGLPPATGAGGAAGGAGPGGNGGASGGNSTGRAPGESAPPQRPQDVFDRVLNPVFNFLDRHAPNWGSYVPDDGSNLAPPFPSDTIGAPGTVFDTYKPIGDLPKDYNPAGPQPGSVVPREYL